MLTGNVLITGGSGFLGRAIIRRARKENWNANFTIYSRDEYKQDLCKRKFPDAQYVLGDIRDIERLSLALLHQDVVIHAAALKYVPEAENNVSECVGINVSGTSAVCVAVRLSKSVRTMVNISTDKAVESANTYGLTKALGERIVFEYAREVDDKKYVSVRYGNVVGSTGSVVPVFKRQAAETGSVRVTDPKMTRFWISADQAVDLICTAAEGKSGRITIPEPMAMSVAKVVEAVTPNVPVNVVGTRPGEKIHEKLLTLRESLSVDIPSERIGANLYQYDPRIPHNKAITPFELTSDKAGQMSVSEFLHLVADAETI